MARKVSTSLYICKVRAEELEAESAQHALIGPGELALEGSDVGAVRIRRASQPFLTGGHGTGCA